MDRNAGSFVAVRRLSGASCHHPSPAEVVSGSTAWIGRGFACVCAQRRESHERISFDLSPAQEECLQRLQNRIEVPYDSSNGTHQKSFQELLCKQNGDRALWEYPFAVAGVNITFMLIQMLDLQAGAFHTDQIMKLALQVVIKSTRRQLERELVLEDIQRIEDMPSYRFLDR
ncbi:hypothetical protein ABZP36_007491 [Zizania latifolia]